MSGIAILDVVIGLTFVYLLLSLLCTTINEWAAALFRRRPRTLYDGLVRMLGEVHAKKLLDEPLIQSLKQDEKTPSYIPADKFALALISVVSGDRKQAPDPDALLKKVNEADAASMPLQALLPLLHVAGNNMEAVRGQIEFWYNDSMDRLSGLYKRYNMIYLVVISFMLALAVNADTFLICRVLWNDPAARAATVAAATEYVKEHRKLPEPTTRPADIQAQLNSVLAPLGWRHVGREIDGKDGLELSEWVLWKGFGLMFTAAALSLGAPFWFDTLNRFINVRSAIKPDDDTDNKAARKK